MRATLYRTHLFLFFFVMLPFFSIGQNKQISGQVSSSENKQALSGVTVTEKGTRNSVITDAEGRFRITLQGKTNVLVFSSSSFVTQEVPVGNSTTLNVEMVPEIKEIEDVVVIGYQTVRRRDVLASV
ncbi:MAG: carboxypeptidase-like regulatory domain-containing protein, partial [Chitinophagaceae bacterium]|nr:carboxypeptidase-like regulatory domain-containing protein [Chitinophagaceae bacterium]